MVVVVDVVGLNYKVVIEGVPLTGITHDDTLLV
jgi:hypothetical protein